MKNIIGNQNISRWLVEGGPQAEKALAVAHHVDNNLGDHEMINTLYDLLGVGEA